MMGEEGSEPTRQLLKSLYMQMQSFAKFGVGKGHLLHFAFFMNNLLSASEGDISAFRNNLGFGSGWRRSCSYCWEREFCPVREKIGQVSLPSCKTLKSQCF